MQENYLGNWIQVCYFLSVLVNADLLHCFGQLKAVSFDWDNRLCSTHCHRKTSKMESWFWEVMGVSSIVRLLRSICLIDVFLLSFFFIFCYVAAMSKFLFVVVKFCEDNYQNCCGKWCWKNPGWKVGHSSIVIYHLFASKMKNANECCLWWAEMVLCLPLLFLLSFENTRQAIGTPNVCSRLVVTTLNWFNLTSL